MGGVWSYFFSKSNAKEWHSTESIQENECETVSLESHCPTKEAVEKNAHDLHDSDKSEGSESSPIDWCDETQVEQISPFKLSLKWAKPTINDLSCKIKSYCVEVLGNGKITKLNIEEPHCDVVTCEVDCLPNINYSFTIQANMHPDSYSCKRSGVFTLKATPGELAFAKLTQSCKCIKKEPPRILVPNLKISKSNSSHTQYMRKYYLGEAKPEHPEKVIMIVGATGSGKSTLINGMFNYILGVKWGDKHRFQLIEESHLEQAHDQSHSQTTAITAYTLYYQDFFTFPYTLTIIDTPGFGDTSGIKRDQEITRHIKHFFTVSSDGIDSIDAIGFVAQSSLPRLTPTQKYIFDQVLSLFGKDIGNNIFMLLTFADGQPPQVLSGIKSANLPFKKDFKFNNSALYVANDYSIESKEDGEQKSMFDEMFWKMGEVSFASFFRSLIDVQKQSLTLTREVLFERERIECSLCSIQHEIKKGLNQLEILKKEIEVLKIYQGDIDRSKNYTYEVDEEVSKTKAIPNGQHITNCLECNYTCHNPCAIADDSGKRGCAAMNTTGYCTVCPKSCVWHKHKNMRYEIIFVRKKVTKKVNDLFKQYEEANGKKKDVAETIKAIFFKFAALQMSVLYMTDVVRQSLNRLGEIALRPNPLSAVEYIDILIASEEREGREGWKQRIEQLTAVRKQTEYLNSVTTADFDPFENYLGSVAKNALELFHDVIDPIVSQGFQPFQEALKREKEKENTDKGHWHNASTFVEKTFSKLKSMLSFKK